MSRLQVPCRTSVPLRCLTVCEIKVEIEEKGEKEGQVERERGRGRWQPRLRPLSHYIKGQPLEQCTIVDLVSHTRERGPLEGIHVAVT